MSLSRLFGCHLLLLLCMLSISGSSSINGQNEPALLELHWIDQIKYPNAICNDGSQTGFYLKESLNNDQSVWLVHLMGGHWCWDIDSCNERWQNSQYLMTSSLWPNQRLKTGIFDENPLLNPLHNVNKVYVPYCSSDAWMGDRPASSQTGGWHFRGQRIVEAVLHTLQSDFGMTTSQGTSTLLWSGCSAGGRGAMVNLDYLPSILNDDSLNVYGILDSPMWADIEPFYPLKQISLRSQTQQVYTFANATARVRGSKCGTVYNTDSDSWKCLFGQYKLPLIQLPFLVNGALYDAFQLLWDTDQTDLSDYTPEMKVYAEDPFRSTLSSIAHNLSDNVISAACYHHCTSEEIYYWNITVQGHSFASATSIFLDSLTHIDDSDSMINNNNKWIGECIGGVNCGNGCASADQPY